MAYPRTTLKLLRLLVARLNKRQGIHDAERFTADAFILDRAYGGIRLSRICHDGHGESDISPRGTKAELETWIRAFDAGADYGQRQTCDEIWKYAGVIQRAGGMTYQIWRRTEAHTGEGVFQLTFGADDKPGTLAGYSKLEGMTSRFSANVGDWHFKTLAKDLAPEGRKLARVAKSF